MTVAVEKLITQDILKPARYLGNEFLAVHKPWEKATIRWALTYPEIYEVGASNLGHIILYNILNAQPRQLCDRAYLPAPDFANKLRETETPLFGVESRRSLREFDILGFSLSYELGATNILEMLDLAGIPLTWQKRMSRGEVGENKADVPIYPLIFAGGQTATSNPEPYADFFDFFVLGDGEELLPEIGLVLEEGKTSGLSREELLLDLAQVPGVYVPKFYDMIEDGSVHPNRPDVPKQILRRVATPMPAYSIGLLPYIEPVHDRLTIEIRRGCTRGCRFCQPGMLTRPARDVEPEKVVEAIESGMRQTGYNEFSLLSLSCSDYLSLPAVGMEIKNRLKNENITLTLPSQRVDRFDENIANILGGTRQSGLTFAPEAGTQRMRDIVNKGLTNVELLRGVKTAWEQGWDKIKLYFMIGLPGETDADVLGIAETVSWLQRECRSAGRKSLLFNLTISNFTPKPHTPFQWHSVSTVEFKHKQELLRQAFRRLKGVKVNFTDVRLSAMEDFIGRGDRTLAPVLHRAWELGAGMDAWYDNINKAFTAWEQAIAEAGLDWKYRLVEKGEWNLFEWGTGEEGSQRPSALARSPLASPRVRGLANATLTQSPAAGNPPAALPHRAEVPSRSYPALASPSSPDGDAPRTTLAPVEATGVGSGRQGETDSTPPLSHSPTLPLPHSPTPPIPHSLDLPLPWDHIDTGIDKKWLQEDLQRALSAATVADCSFEGCSHCGVCSTDFGHNVVIPPLPIPEFSGEFVPNTTKAQRVRVGFGKLGDMALISHLDLMRLFDRAMRRSGLPISFTGGFHPTPRISIANALSLGSTSSGEIVDFELTQLVDEETFRFQLALALPADIPIYNIETLLLKAPAASQVLAAAEYSITVACVETATIAQWQSWIDTIRLKDEIWYEQVTKSGKVQQVNLRDRLFELEFKELLSQPAVILRYVGSCRNDGMVLRPEHILFMLESVAGAEFQLLHIHRNRLILGV